MQTLVKGYFKRIYTLHYIRRLGGTATSAWQRRARSRIGPQPAATSLPDAGTGATRAAIHAAASRSRNSAAARRTKLDGNSALGLERRTGDFVAQVNLTFGPREPLFFK